MHATPNQIATWKHDIKNIKYDIENLHTFIPIFGAISTENQQLIMGNINNIIGELVEIGLKAHNYSIGHTCKELVINAFSLLYTLYKAQLST